MKRFLALTLVLALALVLAACSGSNVQSMMQDSGSSSSTPAESTPAESTPAAPADNSYIGRPEEEMGVHTDDATYFEGRMGDHMRNVFFEYTVNSVDYPASYEGITASDGNQLVVANVTVRNTFSQNLPMSFFDFQVQWGEGDEDYGYQYRYMDTVDADFDYDAEVLVGNMMPIEYEIKRADSVTYDIVYEVPADATEFSISYLEVWNDDSEGDVFFVYFEK